jgi:DNA-binding NarL/FixJ family response regulator
MRRVMIVEDQTAIRDLLKGAIESVEGFQVIGFAGDVGEVPDLCRRHQPDVLILDLGLPSGSGFDVVPQVKAVCPRTRIVIFSGNLRPGTIRRALFSGADAFVEKTAPLEEFREALTAAGAGQVYFSRFASEQVRRIVSGDDDGPRRDVRLTERDKSVLRLIADGLGTRQIADSLSLSHHTVGNIRSRLVRKTGLRGVAHLTRYAVQVGLVPEAMDAAAETI